MFNKEIEELLLKYVESLNIPHCNNALNVRNHVESVKEKTKEG
jgi:hypothetical protein